MREIKFRAWHKQEKNMYEVIGLRLDVQHGMYPSSRVNYVDLCDKSQSFIEGDEVELMQFTGLKDSNDKKIYEGDIVEIRNLYDTQHAQVVWSDFHSLNQWDMSEAWVLHFAKPQGREPVNAPLYPFCHFDMRIAVIGNIYENPELIEEPTP